MQSKFIEGKLPPGLLTDAQAQTLINSVLYIIEMDNMMTEAFEIFDGFTESQIEELKLDTTIY